MKCSLSEEWRDVSTRVRSRRERAAPPALDGTQLHRREKRTLSSKGMREKKEERRERERERKKERERGTEREREIL